MSVLSKSPWWFSSSFVVVFVGCLHGYKELRTLSSQDTSSAMASHGSPRPGYLIASIWVNNSKMLQDASLEWSTMWKEEGKQKWKHWAEWTLRKLLVLRNGRHRMDTPNVCLGRTLSFAWSVLFIPTCTCTSGTLTSRGRKFQGEFVTSVSISMLTFLPLHQHRHNNNNTIIINSNWNKKGHHETSINTCWYCLRRNRSV